MGTRAKDLVERFKAFNDEFAAFVEDCSDEAWKKICSGEKWSVGVVKGDVLKEFNRRGRT